MASLPNQQAGYEDGAKWPSVVEPPPYANHFRIKGPGKDNQCHLVNLFQIKQQEGEQSIRIISFHKRKQVSRYVPDRAVSHGSRNPQEESGTLVRNGDMF